MDSLSNFINSIPKIPDFVVLIIFTIAVFLVMRFLVLWYWKINEIVNLLEKIKNNTDPENNKNINNKKDQ